MTTPPLPQLGFGLGLRATHYPYIFEHRPAIDWFEIISENFMDTDGKPKRNLARIREHYPIVMHGVGMSIGTVDPLNSEYLQKLKALIDWVKPAWVSDHLCWTGVAHKTTHDLLPVPYTEEALRHIIDRIKTVQDVLGMPIALENPSTYLEFNSSTLPEAEFIAHMATESGCNLLLDVNNVYVTCYNHRLDAKSYLDALPLDRVIQIHLSGHRNKGTHIIDTHDEPVIDAVWELYKYVVHKAGRTPNTMIEWDDDIPEFPILFAELEKAKTAAKHPLPHALPQLAQASPPYMKNQPVALADEQAQLQQAILCGPAFDSQPQAWIRHKEAFPPADQLAVYVNGYRFRLRDVVAMDYPVLTHAMGKDAFDQLVMDFVDSIPADHFNVGRYAAKLPKFLATHTASNPFLIELCKLETAISQLADKQETAALEPKHLEGMTPEMLMESQLFPRVALRLFSFNYPVNDYYRAVQDNQSPTLPSKQPSYLAVFRHEDTMWRLDLEKLEYQLLQRLFAGDTVGDALDDLDESITESLSKWFSRWIRNGLLAVNDSQAPAASHNTA